MINITSLRSAASLLFLLFAFLNQSTWAAVIITGTRVIYPADARDVNIKLTNVGDIPALVQVWLDDGDPKASPENIKVPFVLTPPVSRIDPSKNQSLRLIYTGEANSQDKEALYWFNMLEIPPKPTGGDNYLQFAVRTRIKVFYRPAHLKEGPKAAAPLVEWRAAREGDKLVLSANNPTPYYVSLSGVRLVSKDGQETGTPMNATLAPGVTQNIVFEDVKAEPASLAAVRYQLIDDFGSSIDGEKPLKGPTP